MLCFQCVRREEGSLPLLTQGYVLYAGITGVFVLLGIVIETRHQPFIPQQSGEGRRCVFSLTLPSAEFTLQENYLLSATGITGRAHSLPRSQGRFCSDMGNGVMGRTRERYRRLPHTAFV